MQKGRSLPPREPFERNAERDERPKRHRDRSGVGTLIATGRRLPRSAARLQEQQHVDRICLTKDRVVDRHPCGSREKPCWE